MRSKYVFPRGNIDKRFYRVCESVSDMKFTGAFKLKVNKYTKGRLNVVADVLSRPSTDDLEDDLTINLVSVKLPCETTRDLGKEQFGPACDEL